MTDVLVVNASPLIILAKAGHLDVLERSAPSIFVPDAVRAEILAGPPGDPARAAMSQSWGRPFSVPRVPAEVLEWGLGAGETDVIAAALLLPASIVVLDDAQARSCARTLGLPMIGTLGIVLRAKRRGLLPAAAPLIHDLLAAGMRIDPDTIESSLRCVGEVWP